MVEVKRATIKIYRHFMHDSLRRNSSLLILSQAINAGAAFIFWIICARLFKTKDVGLATSFVSFGVLVSTFTSLGLPNTIVRFLPTSKKRGGLFTSSLYLIALSSAVGGLIGLAILRIVVPKLGFVHSSIYLSTMLLLLVAFTTISSFMDGSLMAFRKGQYIVGKALIVNAPRIIVPFFVVALAAKGIVTTYVIVLVFGIAYNLVIVFNKLLKKESFKPSLAELVMHKGFAAGNYFGGMLGILPSTLVPLIILSKLGAQAAAFFYMPMQVAGFLGIISSSTSQAMISEASQTNNESEYAKHFIKAFKHVYVMLIPAIIGIGLLGWPILKAYGGIYANRGYIPLLILAGASLFVAVNWLGDTWLNVKQHSRAYFFMNGFNALVVVAGVYLFASHGLASAAIGWLVGQVISAIVYLAIFARGQLFSFVGSLKSPL